MTKLAKYLKPFLWGLLFAVLLLFGQAMADLSLPDYMSDIVNVGIQQGGIETAAPEAVSAKGLDLIKLFMTAQQREEIERDYELVSAAEAGGRQDEYTARYPLLETEDIYVLKEDAPQENIERILGESAWTMINTMKTLGEQSGGESAAAEDADLQALDFSQLYALQPMLEQIPAGVIDQAREQAVSEAESFFPQSAVTMTQSFYRELGMDMNRIQRNYIVQKGLWMLLIALLGGIATILVAFLSSRIGAGVARNLRQDVFGKVEQFSQREFDRHSTASLITRTTNDVTQVQMMINMGIRMVCYSPILGIGGIVMALRKSSSMSWIIALACVVLIGLVLIVFAIAMPKFKIVQKLVDRLNLVARENLNGLMVIRAFGTQKFEEERFDKSNRDLTENSLFVNRVMTFMMPAMTLVMNFVTLLIVWVGAHRIADSTMQVGDMMAFMQYAMQIITSFLMIAMMFVMVPRAAVSGNRIAEVLYTEPSIKDPENPRSFEKKDTGLVTFRHVSFRYDGAQEDVLHDISFTAKPGQTTAFIGSTGSGKSTLVSLIPRFYDVTQGEIEVNGVDVRQVPQEALRDQIGYIPQKGILLSGTIASNLRYGDQGATQEELEEAASIAQAIDFIDEKPDRFESEIAQGGANVSGGQKQRLSIARALVKKAPIYIFDDSFSALDFKTDAALRRALKEKTADSTMLIVAQRVSTIMNADQIIVLDEGRVVGMGPHRQLLQSCPTYHEIASSQLSKEELA